MLFLAILQAPAVECEWRYQALLRMVSVLRRRSLSIDASISVEILVIIWA